MSITGPPPKFHGTRDILRLLGPHSSPAPIPDPELLTQLLTELCTRAWTYADGCRQSAEKLAGHVDVFGFVRSHADSVNTGRKLTPFHRSNIDPPLRATDRAACSFRERHHLLDGRPAILAGPI